MRTVRIRFFGILDWITCLRATAPGPLAAGMSGSAGNLLRAGGPTVDQAEPNPAGMSSVSPKKVLDDFPTPFGEVHFQVVSPVVVKGSKIRQIVDRIGSNCTGHLQRGRRAR